MRKLTLWPFHSFPACVVRESDGATFIIQPVQQPQQGFLARNPWGAPSLRIACVAQDNTLVCIDKGTTRGHMYEHQISAQTDGHRHLAKVSDKLGWVDRSLNHTSKVAIRSAGGKQILVICTMKGEIMRYARTP